MKNLNSKSYNQVLQEAADYFSAQGVSILGRGYEEIATNPSLFEAYVDTLTEGCSANDAKNIAQLMINTNKGILQESSITGITPVASLSMPVIRKLWPKFALKDAIDNEVAQSPRFVIPYSVPFMVRGTEDGEEERIDIPRGIRTGAMDGDLVPDSLKKTYLDVYSIDGYTDTSLAADPAGDIYIDETAGTITLAAGKAVTLGFNTTISSTSSRIKTQPLDELVIDSATYTDDDDEEVAIKIGKRLGVYGNGVYPFDGGSLLIQFDGKKGQAVVAAIGRKVTFAIRAAMSSEYNEESWSVGFDIKRQDIDIPTGQHLNANLPIEALQDLNALYQIDGTKETVDLMTNVFAQKLDLEILDFLKKSFFDQPGNEAFFDYPDAMEYGVVFDCKPAAGFAGSPKAWREELKPLIDHLAQRILNNTLLQSGMFTIVANPIDVQILANIDWSFRGGQGGNVDGVDVNYSVGTYTGANAYRVIASTNVPAGQMFLVFIPSGKTQMTYKYYSYTFSTEMGYIDPNRSRVPSIMMTKRDTKAEFMPAIGLIVIENNDGKSYFRQYTEWKDVDADSADEDTGTGTGG